MNDRRQLHNERILKQFEMQAVPFAEMPAHADSMELLIELCQARPDDEALDVACGPGLVGCSLAPRVRHVTGIDITPKMIGQARKLQSEKGETSRSLARTRSEPAGDGQTRIGVRSTRGSNSPIQGGDGAGGRTGRLLPQSGGRRPDSNSVPAGPGLGRRSYGRRGSPGRRRDSLRLPDSRGRGFPSVSRERPFPCRMGQGRRGILQSWDDDQVVVVVLKIGRSKEFYR